MQQNTHCIQLFSAGYCTMARLLLCCLVASLQLPAQVAVPDSLVPKNTRIEHMDEFIILKFTQSSDIEKLAVLTPGLDIRLSPNATTVSGLSFSYRFIYFSLNYVPKFIPGNNDDSRKGKTGSGGLSFSLNFRHWYNSFSYNRTKGYYLENTSDFDPSWNSSKPYTQFPKLVFTQYEGLTAYNFNPQYSISAITFQTERQLRSAGSFIPQFRCRYYISDDRSALLPNRFTQKAQNLELLVGAGYHYSFVTRERFYVSLGATPNAGYVFSRITTRSATESSTGNQRNPVFRLDGRAGTGYNSRRFFAGVYMNLSASAYNQQHTSVVTKDDKVAFQAFIGYRLNAPKWLKETVEKAGKKVSLQ